MFGWLQKRLEDVLEAIKLIQWASQCKQTNAEINEESKKALKSYEASILEYEAKLQTLKASLEKEKINAAEINTKTPSKESQNCFPNYNTL
ncbi:hypothetical protein CCACVL1_30825 [Corchorus capsularis]|uniref:Uncharacterized protein n=1 Tax=Corchorus capsularis TaxID=210143 RepID=A0A1R3FV80_COCAP|nr:hypothetical protein CCACVL1_30825 [Corchorus capsularis]